MHSYYYFFYDIEVEILCYDITSAINTIISDKKLIKSIDLLGRVTHNQYNSVLFYIYDDGTVEKKIIIE